MLYKSSLSQSATFDDLPFCFVVSAVFVAVVLDVDREYHTRY